MLSEMKDVYIVSETIAIKSVKIIKEITVVTKIARTIELGSTLQAAQRAKENAPHGPRDTRNVPRKSVG